MKQKFPIAMSLAVILAMLLTSIDAQAIQADTTPAACTPPPPNMVSWWPGDGNADDLIGTNPGTLQGGATFVEGQVGQAFQFDGAGEVEIADSPSLDVQAFTIDAWVFPTAADGGVDVILNKEPVSGFRTLTAQYEIGIRGSFEPGMGTIPEGNFAFFIGGIYGLPNEYRAWVDGGGPIPHNEWTHVALVFDGTSARTYINGVQTRGIAALGGTVPVLPSPLKIGSRSATEVNQYPQGRFNGRIDEVELFNRPLTGTEINAIYGAGPSGKCKTGTTPAACTPPPPNMVSWWPGDGNADDLIGTNPGTLQGGATFVEGQVGQAFQFDGAGEVEIADSPGLNLQTFTIDAWVFPTAADGGVDVILNKEPVSIFSTLTTQYEIGIRGSFEPGMGTIPEGNFAFFIGGIYGLPNEYRAWVDGGGPIPHNEWTHVALVFDGTSARTYINGVQAREVHGLSGAVPVSSGPLKIGSRSAIQTDLVSPEPFNGRIDEVELFNRALTSTEINAIYSAGPSGKCKTDTTPPVITADVQGVPGDWSDWYISPVYVTWSVVDDESSFSSSSGCDPTWIYQDTLGTTLTCSATSEGGTIFESVIIRIDRTPPTIYGTTSPAPNSFGWNNTDVTVSFTCDDWGSGVMYCEPDRTFTEDGFWGVSARAVDHVWNDERLSYGASIDKTAPTVSLVGGPANGGTYYFGFVPTAPTCTASDALSGLDGSCSVSGYSTAVGSHTVTASATDKAGNSASASATYTVLAWSLSGFYAPVDMNGVYNVVRSGSPVSLKFEVFAGLKELTFTSAVTSLTQTRITCDGRAPIDSVIMTGGSSLRYDATAGQFIQKWQTPRQAGQCYRVTMTTQDGSSLVAFFKLR